MKKNLLMVVFYIAFAFIIIILGSNAFYYRERARIKDTVLKDYQFIVNKIYEVDCTYSNLPINVTNSIDKQGSILVYKSKNIVDEYFGIALTVENDRIIKVELHKP